MLKHVNEIKFEGDTPWVKAFNEASDHWLKYCDGSLTKEERHFNFEQWSIIRYELESGRYGNNS
jgi:hypothetical protein